MAQDLVMRDAEEDDGESEWEYEYDPNEFEDHYLILDVPFPTGPSASKDTTAHELFALHDRSNPKPPKKPRAPKPTTGGRGGRGKGSRARRSKPAPVSEEEANADPDDQDVDQSQAAGEDGDAAAKASSTKKKKEKETIPDPTEIEILGLHSEEPIISYDGNIYSCQWTTSVGTNMLFTKVDEDDENQDRNALTSLGSWDLLGLGAATLVASPATIHPRRRMPLVSQPAVHATTGTGLSSMEMDDDKLQQDSFLKRFADIKQSKGEADQHTLSTLQGKTTAEGRALAPVRKGGPRPKALTQSSKSSPRGTRSRAASNASTPASQPDDSQNSSAPATFNAWANFASPPITRPPPPVFPGFPAQNLREDDPGEPAEEES